MDTTLHPIILGTLYLFAEALMLIFPEETASMAASMSSFFHCKRGFLLSPPLALGLDIMAIYSVP